METKPTFRDILQGQDLGADKVFEQIKGGTFDFNNDPITHVIYNSFIKNESSPTSDKFDVDSAITDLNYAISMLQRAKNNYEKFQ